MIVFGFWIILFLILAFLSGLVWNIISFTVTTIFSFIKHILPFLIIVVICDFIIETFEGNL